MVSPNVHGSRAGGGTPASLSLKRSSGLPGGLRERAVSDPRVAEILLRWQQRPRQVSDGDQLQGLTEEQLEGLYAALLRLSALSAEEQSTVLEGLLDGRV
jgi:hypothetical protein